MAAVWVRSGGAWTKATAVWLRQGGAWVKAAALGVRSAGAWVLLAALSGPAMTSLSKSYLYIPDNSPPSNLWSVPYAAANALSVVWQWSTDGVTWQPEQVVVGAAGTISFDYPATYSVLYFRVKAAENADGSGLQSSFLTV